TPPMCVKREAGGWERKEYGMRPEVWDSERRSVDSRPGRASANVELAAHLAVEAAGIGAWDIAPTTREARWSARAKWLLGFSIEDITGRPLGASGLGGRRQDIVGELSDMPLAVELGGRNVPAAKATELLSRVQAMANGADRMFDQLLPADPSEHEALPLRRTA